jgi:GNAT superfamily N-acetyltransferase
MNLKICKLCQLDKKLSKTIAEFNCGNDDLNDFFHNDALNYSSELLGKSYCFISEKDNSIACCFTICNDALYVRPLPNSSKRTVRKNLPFSKYHKKYPAVLIGRMGVSEKFQHLRLGSQILDFVKFWFLDKENKTGCRFLTVDAYYPAIAFYEKNGFQFLYKNEKDEKEQNGFSAEEQLRTRSMFFDLGILR